MEKHFYGTVVSHTHWDREWYLSFQEFRKWLVKNIDDLLDNLPNHPDFKSFMLDGQTVVLEDYLEIRPYRKGDLQQMIEQKRLEVGPFYVLADEFLESGEGIIRNLLLGHKISESYGATTKVGYVPDTFGHIWQMPQILQGFRIPYMYYYRGYPPVFGNHEEYQGKNEETPLEHYYQSPNGDKVLTLHQITGYGNASDFTQGAREDIEEFPYFNAVMRIGDMFGRAGPRTATNQFLFMNGTDHKQAEWKITDLIDKWNANEELQEDFPLTLKHGTMTDYFKQVEEDLKTISIPTITGEARGSAYTQVTPGCISTRMNLKLENWEVTRELEKYAEPFSTMSWMMGAQYQHDFIELGWKWLIKNHPHDSICGCSLDRVHADMITRFRWAYDNAADVANYSCASILSGINLESLKAKVKENHPNITAQTDVRFLGVFNPNLDSSPQIVSEYLSLGLNKSYKLYDYSGQEIKDYHIEYIPDYRDDIEQGQYLYKRFQKEWCLGKLTARPETIPSLGYKIYYLLEVEGNQSPESAVVTTIPEPIETTTIKVSFNQNGSINFFDKETNMEYKQLNIFEDEADDGDEYDYAHLDGVKPLYTSGLSAKYSILEKNPMFTKVQAVIPFTIPYELEGDADTTRVRSATTATMPITTTYTIYNNDKRIDIESDVQNKAKGHRLRAIFPVGFATTYSNADDHFMVMQRTVELPRDDGWYQDMQGIYHQDTFVDLDKEGKAGLALFNHGLCEFEIIKYPNESLDAIALTLFRSVAWLSQKGHSGRKSGLNGPNLQTPGAQLMDMKFKLEYSIFSHKGNWQTGGVYQKAHAYNSPPRWFAFKHDLRNEDLSGKDLPLERSFFATDNPNVILSSLKGTEELKDHKDGIILRLFNPTSTSQKVNIELGMNYKEIFEVNLLEENLNQIPAKPQISLEIPTGSIKTLKFILE